MAIIYGTLNKILEYDDSNGYSFFLLKKLDGECVGVRGYIPKFYYATPLECIGEFHGKYFTANSCKLYEENTDLIKVFLSSKTFRGIKSVGADSIVSTISSHIFTFIDNPNAFETFMTIKKIHSDYLNNAFKKIEYTTILNTLFEYVQNSELIKELFDIYGPKIKRLIKANPYITLNYGGNFNHCENTAKKIGIEAFDKHRVEQIVRYAMTLNRNNGHTKISFDNLVNQIHKLEKNAKAGYNTKVIFIAGALISNNYTVNKEDSNVFVYLKKDFDNELKIAQHIQRLQGNSHCIKKSVPVSQIEDMCKITYSDSQKKALDSINTTGIKIITGGPGTGKTTLLLGILEKYKLVNDTPIYLAAPTGCAAKRMEETTHQKASTIHKLLNIRPFNKTEIVGATLNTGLYIIDESSMIDTELCGLLLSAIPNDSTVIFMGDKDQLPSVGAGNILNDLIASNLIDTYRLTHVFRQGDDIADNAYKVIHGDTNLTFNRSKNFVIERFKKEKDIINRCLFLMNKAYTKDKKADIKVFSPSKQLKFESSTKNINNRIQELLHNKDEDYIVYGNTRFYVNDKVLFTANNYDKGYYNGDDGVVTSIEKNGYNYQLNIKLDDKDISITNEDLKNLELAYAITAHKSQGSETMAALIIVPKKPKSLLLRQLVYVEITRAKKQVVILSQEDALECAIKDVIKCKRATGLKNKLIQSQKERMV